MKIYLSPTLFPLGQGLLNFICYGLNDKLKQAWLQVNAKNGRKVAPSMPQLEVASAENGGFGDGRWRSECFAVFSWP